MIEPEVQRFRGHDGVERAYRELGEGRPLVLIHGFLGSGEHWLRPGHAARLAGLGYRVIMPDLRGHGDSAKPHDAEAYPPDVLTDDGLALIDALALSDYDLGGYSLGARTTVRMLARGARARRAIIAGMGLEGLIHTTGRGGQFRHLLTNFGTFEFGSPDWKAEAYLNKIKADPVALLHALGTSIDTPREQLEALELPALVLVGADDERHRSAAEVAALLPNARHVVLAGDHSTVAATPEFGATIADFLGSAGAPALQA